MNTILLYFSIKYKGDWDAIFSALENKEHVSLKEIQTLEKELKNKKYSYITILDSNYPNKLKAAYKPPFVIWYEGDIKMLNNMLLCLSGEEVTDIDKNRIDKFLPEVHKNHRLVMGHFKGLSDYLIKKSQEMIQICAQGINTIKRDIYSKNTLFISEYPYDTKPKKDHFANRNRIISSFCESLILFNSRKQSGINSLINSFLNQGKDIYCFPGDGSSEDGNSELIKTGANLITSIQDITC